MWRSRDSEERYRRLFENSKDAVVINTPEGKFIDFNESFLDLLGYSRSELLELSVAEMYADAADRDEFRKEIERNGFVKDFDVKFRRKDGSVRDCLLTSTAWKDKKGHIIGYQGIVRDITERKRMEEEIKSLAAYPLQDPNPVLRLSREGIILHANPASKALLQSWGCEIWDQAPEYWRDLASEVLQSRSLRNIDVEIGEKVYLFTASPVNDASCVNLYGRDITERTRTEDELRRSEGRFRKIFQSNPIPALITAIEGPVLDVNEAWVRMMGFSRREAIGHSTIELGMAQDPKQRDQIVKDLLEKKRLSNIEMTRRTKSGELRYISNTLELVDLEGQKCILNMQVDITERKKMEDELKKYSEHLEELVEQRTRDVRESEEKYHHLVDNLTDTVFTIDLKGNLTFCSQAGEKMTGYPVQQLLSMSVTDLAAPEHMAEIQRRLEARMRGEESLPPLQFEIIRADGKRLAIEMVTSTLAKEGNLIGIQGIARDITERKEIERLREQATATLLEDAVRRTELEKLKDKFISTVTHELRTPLVSIKGYVDLILEGSGSITEDVHSNLSVVRRNTDRLLGLVNDLLDLSRMQAGRFKLELQPVDFKTVIQSCMVEAKPLVEEKKLSVEIEVPEKPLQIQGDQVRLCQVLMNLLSNATKFSPEGSDVTLRVEEENKSIKVQVSDRGIGIRKEDLERVFEPFSAIDKPAYIKGTGLGLSITKGLVEAHGGKIWAQSEGEGKGATFTFTLPKQGI